MTRSRSERGLVFLLLISVALKEENPVGYAPTFYMCYEIE